MRVLTLMFILSFLAACGQTRIVEKPVPVEVVRVERVTVPHQLLVQYTKSGIPKNLTYGEAIQLWSADRANIDVLNAQIAAIESLNESEDR